ncbi:MAG: hypothetical protein MPJ50_01305 [Pirellulales bacterium]|nr:hypothetical protein [Pirellulales bacterium]
MQHRWMIAVCLVALVGCRNANPCRDLMRENFELNEWILQQEIRIDEQDREIQRLKALTDAEQDFEEQVEGLEPPSVDFGDGGAAPAFPRPGDPGNPLDDEVPPAPFNPNRNAPPSDMPPDGGALNDLELILPGLDVRPGAPVDSIGKVEKIIIDPRRTRALNLDGARGDDGLVVVFEPRDAQDQPLAALGELSIVAVDPSLPEHLARVARWDYQEDEVRDLLVRTRQGPKVVCQLLWPNAPPESSRLQLYVRMKTTDGTSHVADMPLLADFAGVEPDGARFARTPDNTVRELESEATTASEHGTSLDDYLRGAYDKGQDRPSTRNSSTDATTEDRPLRRVAVPGEDPPRPMRHRGEDPIRTTQRALPPWSPTRK